MSFSIVINVPDGFVIASDRRLTYQRTEESDSRPPLHLNNVYITDSTRMVFKCPNGCGISLSGICVIDGMNLETAMQEFIELNVHEYTDIDDIPQLMIDHFRTFIDRVDNNIFVAGYGKKDGVFVQKLYYVYLHSLSFSEMDITQPGAMWDGDRTPMSRLILDLYQKKEDHWEAMPNFSILWRYFTLQEAVDFARFAVNTTRETLRFWSMPEFVSKEMDILILKPQDAYWVEGGTVKPSFY